jgi:flagellar biosynthetic protein FliR
MVLNANQLGHFALILARVVGLFISAPILKSRTFFTLAKMAFALWITIVFWFVVPPPTQMPSASFTFVLALLSEVLIGVMIGFVTDMILSAVEFGGHLIDAQMGLTTGQTLDPTSGNSTTIVSRLLRWSAIMIFFAVNGHHMLLSAIYQSFRLVPLAQPVNFAAASDEMVKLGTMLFGIGTQIAMPVILVIFFLDFALGMVSRVAPQVNVFQLGMEVKPTVGAVVFMMMVPFVFNYISPIMSNVLDEVIKVVMALRQNPI